DPSSLRSLVMQRRAGPPRPFTTRSTVSSAIARYVVSLPPVIVITPSGSLHTLWRRDRSAVRLDTCAPPAGERRGRRPAHTPVTSARVRLARLTSLAAASR